MAERALDIRNLSVNVGNFSLANVNLALEERDYVVLLGPSGCGKTTFLKAIVGIQPVGEGAVFIGDTDASHIPPHKRRISYVAQAVDLFPHMTVADNIRFGLRYIEGGENEKRKRYDRIIDLLSIRELLGRSPVTLSGGESKRVALARGLVVEPRVLLLDEPLSMLDPNARREMLDVLRMIHDEIGTATIHVTHEREEAWALDARCAVMIGGRLLQTGSVNDLFRRPKNSAVAEFLGGSNVFEVRFKKQWTNTYAVLPWGEYEISQPVDYLGGFVQIRPEDLSISTGVSHHNIVSTVKNISDRGAYIEMTAEVEGGAIIRAHLPQHSLLPKVGQNVALKLNTPPHPMER